MTLKQAGVKGEGVDFTSWDVSAVARVERPFIYAYLFLDTIYVRIQREGMAIV